MNFEPYADKIVVKPLIKEKTEGGIYIPETQDMAHIMSGEVVAVSNGFVSGGKEFPCTSKIGDIVYFQRGVGIPFEFGGEKYLILQEATVWGRIKNIGKNIETDKALTFGDQIIVD